MFNSFLLLYTQTPHFRYHLPYFTPIPIFIRGTIGHYLGAFVTVYFPVAYPPVVCVIAPPPPKFILWSFSVLFRDSREVEIYLLYCWLSLVWVLIRIPAMLTLTDAGLVVGNVIRGYVADDRMRMKSVSSVSFFGDVEGIQHFLLP
jgi:hypothetical protein